jgi:hypothetical protein
MKNVIVLVSECTLLHKYYMLYSQKCLSLVIDSQIAIAQFAVIVSVHVQQYKILL